jgi:tetratricopeptide (TPR) repeat protein
MDEDNAFSKSLESAVAATRRAFEGDAPDARATERRILETARTRARFRPRLWLVPLAAAFVGSVALAHELGAFGALKGRWFGQTVAPPAVQSAGPAPAPQPSAREPATVVSPVAPALPVPAKSAEPAPVKAPMPNAERETAKNPEPALSAPASLAPSDEKAKLDEMSLYRDAHQAHFSERNYALALFRWDRYLELAPRGTFALEARYNRGIALHRLGRREEAVAALRPFADGAYGGYRSEEASRILNDSK